jgi:creatinine amidohydrolase/Fe(II)-dependent formamide hydrolase-like protein
MDEDVRELEALTALQLQQLVGNGVATVVVPFGSVEHHGGHLPMGADALLADAVGKECSRRLGAVLAPTFRIGCSDRHAALAGTVTLRRETLTAVATQTARALARHGFTVIALVSAHGGNRVALEAAVAELTGSLSGAIACAPSGDVGPSPGAYSGSWLTSVMLALSPELVDLAQASPDLIPELETASARRGEEHIERFVDSIVARVRAVARP